MAVIGIMSAMHEELAAVLAVMPDEQRVQVAGRDFWVGHWQGHSVVAVLSRIGKVAAATTATVLLERFGVDTLVFTGVAGGLGCGVRVGDVVVADGLVQHDMDASPLFPRHEVPLYGRARFAADADLAVQLAKASEQVLANAALHLGASTLAEFQLHAPKVHQGLILSGDRFVSTSDESHALRQALPEALAVEMEGAAVAQVCHDYGVPFAAVRTISDRADDAAHTDFQRFIREVASRYSLAIVSQWLSQRALG
ncbi:5'-methylthioadenosine/adenosylhomocysteine nucleosidase [Limnohabitans sp. Bal53]|jgi:adenosylhomocysteine nucleosidase|uniref:5'-methylthioadenosine/adenosylhomocysteine nucleosidase n=1 Tax=Limnohabitans sp. Bal53 TaxID=1977910 RepID=UPI000D35B8D4|nr:5'-methylthioadenosine/adenosylhomocysteine nucleosidase [Limnohabitans sp. Bal53]PUE42756.1 5'-methylthioadenosine/S-adenosylhomocysteine nucleosidase [Limnohabitans sp. Bal53]